MVFFFFFFLPTDVKLLKINIPFGLGALSSGLLTFVSRFREQLQAEIGFSAISGAARRSSHGRFQGLALTSATGCTVASFQPRVAVECPPALPAPPESLYSHSISLLGNVGLHLRLSLQPAGPGRSLPLCGPRCTRPSVRAPPSPCFVKSLFPVSLSEAHRERASPCSWPR